ncbi:MAG: 7-cyano-7-deazaguanine synthase QueC [Magnetococcales bacterium]|nr:7-cyano-7-deazaguanine synthase QueC [Magnetococcales bacterium]
MATPKAVVLLSGGMDSATCLHLAAARHYQVHALTVHYGQRHLRELEAARQIALRLPVASHQEVQLDLTGICRSSLTSTEGAVPKGGLAQGIPSTYVPARNTILLSLAMGWAETLQARDIFIGINAIDYSGYPDCRPAFLEAFQHLANLGTRAGVSGQSIRMHAPLLHMSKADIVREGLALGVDFAMTHTCYSPDYRGWACGLCDACRLRLAGFAEAGVQDPAPYLTLPQPVMDVSPDGAFD